MQGRCFIFGAGEYDGAVPKISEGDYVIAADGGYSELSRLGIKPSILVGDMDSIDIPAENIETIRHPVMKDDTDMALAVELGIERGCRDFYIYGGLGGRLDHTLANIQLIVRLARRGYSAFLISARETITAIYNGGIRFPADYEGTISVFAYGGIATGVTETGLLYKLIDAKVFDDVTIGVSNEYTGIPSCVEVKSGTIIVMWQGNLDKKPPELYNFPL